MVSGLRNMTYEQRSKVLGLATFETRMLRADLIQVFFKILHNIDHVDKDKFFYLTGGDMHLSFIKIGLI